MPAARNTQPSLLGFSAVNIQNRGPPRQLMGMAECRRARRRSSATRVWTPRVEAVVNYQEARRRKRPPHRGFARQSRGRVEGAERDSIHLHCRARPRRWGEESHGFLGRALWSLFTTRALRVER